MNGTETLMGLTLIMQIAYIIKFLIKLAIPVIIFGILWYTALYFIRLIILKKSTVEDDQSREKEGIRKTMEFIRQNKIKAEKKRKLNIELEDQERAQ